MFAAGLTRFPENAASESTPEASPALSKVGEPRLADCVPDLGSMPSSLVDPEVSENPVSEGGPESVDAPPSSTALPTTAPASVTTPDAPVIRAAGR